MAKKAMVICVASLLATGCATYSLEKLRHTKPSGTPFQNKLAKLYMDFATDEEKEYDWYSAMHFGDKGLESAYGKDVEPEAIEDWSLPKDKIAEMTRARASLMALLTPEMKKAHPDQLAEAQYNWDCWVEQQQENWQEDDIEACREGMRKAVIALHSDETPGQPTQAEPAATPVEAKPVDEQAETKEEIKPMAPEETLAEKSAEPAKAEEAKPEAAKEEAKPEEPKKEEAKEEVKAEEAKPEAPAEPAKAEEEKPAPKALPFYANKPTPKPEVAPEVKAEEKMEKAEKPKAAAPAKAAVATSGGGGGGGGMAAKSAAARKAAPAAAAETESAEAKPASTSKRIMPTETVSYLVFFENNKSDLSIPGQRVVDDIISSLKDVASYEVVIRGHTDASGGSQYNMHLSRERVDVVKKRLMDGGVKEASIKSYAYGKSLPKFSTSGGSPEPAYRRVEIFLNE